MEQSWSNVSVRDRHHHDPFRVLEDDLSVRALRAPRQRVLHTLDYPVRWARSLPPLVPPTNLLRGNVTTSPLHHVRCSRS